MTKKNGPQNNSHLELNLSKVEARIADQATQKQWKGENIDTIKNLIKYTFIFS